jgi:hypothetical protein
MKPPQPKPGDPPHTPGLRINCQTMFFNKVGPKSSGEAGQTLHSQCHPPSPKTGGNLFAAIAPPPQGILKELLLRGGARRDRTDDLMLAKHALYQLSYGPIQRHRPSSQACRPDPFAKSKPPGSHIYVVGPGRLELPTSRLSGVCSNQLSYRPGIALRPSRPKTWAPKSARSHFQPHSPELARGGWKCAERETETAASRTC